MNSGKIFEKEWKDSIPNDTYYLRIIDPAQSFNQEENKKDNKIRFSPKNKYDAIMYCFPNLFCLELKTTIGTSFSFDGSSPMIKKHQIDELTRASKYKGIIAGFIFNMHKYQKTYFLPINKFNEFKNSAEKKSINQKDILNYDAVEVIGELKRTRTKFYIGEFIEKIKE